MVTLIVGGKGSGKTKRLIDMINKALDESKGNIIAMEKGSKMRYDLTHNVRLIDTDEYYIDGYYSLYGFLAGICAANYDTTDIFVDSTFKICGDDFEELETFLKKINPLMERTETNIAVTISSDEDELPESIKSICKLA